MYTYAYTYTCTHTDTYTDTYTLVHIHVCVYTFVHIIRTCILHNIGKFIHSHWAGTTSLCGPRAVVASAWEATRKQSQSGSAACAHRGAWCTAECVQATAPSAAHAALPKESDASKRLRQLIESYYGRAVQLSLLSVMRLLFLY